MVVHVAKIPSCSVDLWPTNDLLNMQRIYNYQNNMCKHELLPFEVSEQLLQNGNVAENERELGDLSFIPNSSRGEPEI